MSNTPRIIHDPELGAETASAAARHTTIRSLSVIFLAACALNLVWEHVHSNLYIHYKGGEITDLILLRAALFDAAVITLAGFFVLRGYMKRWHAIGILLLFAIGLEVFALYTGRWAYNEYMPMIPVLRTGLTPTIQLALLAYGAFFAASLQRRRT